MRDCRHARRAGDRRGRERRRTDRARRPTSTLGLPDDGRSSDDVLGVDRRTPRRSRDVRRIRVPGASEPSARGSRDVLRGDGSGIAVEAEGDASADIEPRRDASVDRRDQTPSSLEAVAPLRWGRRSRPNRFRPLRSRMLISIERAPSRRSRCPHRRMPRAITRSSATRQSNRSTPFRTMSRRSEPRRVLDARWDELPPAIRAPRRRCFVEVVAPAAMWVPPEPSPRSRVRGVRHRDDGGAVSRAGSSSRRRSTSINASWRSVPTTRSSPSAFVAVEATLRGETAMRSSDVAHDAGAARPVRRFAISSRALLRTSTRAAPAAPPTPEPDAFSSMETPISTPRVETPVTSSATPRVPTPVYDWTSSSRRAMPDADLRAAARSNRRGRTFVARRDDRAARRSTDRQLSTVGRRDRARRRRDAGGTPTPAGAERLPQPPSMRRRCRFRRFGPRLHVERRRSSETVSGSIDALFSGARRVSGGLRCRGHTVAGVRGGRAGAHAGKPLQGVPAHAASSELSLDHVFKTTPARPRETEGDGFSFDQFFADELADGSAKGGARAAVRAGQSRGRRRSVADDIAQFNNWLNGLKKT